MIFNLLGLFVVLSFLSINQMVILLCSHMLGIGICLYCHLQHRLIIGKLNNGNAYIDVYDANQQILFEITPDQCRHLVVLLTQAANRD